LAACPAFPGAGRIGSDMGSSGEPGKPRKRARPAIRDAGNVRVKNVRVKKEQARHPVEGRGPAKSNGFRWDRPRS